MLQDTQGYLWFGTIEGLNRYDGYNFRIYVNSPDDATSISDDLISTIFEDSENNIWVGTRN
jgi:ligand-binding sensor domain-containing protein